MADVDPLTPERVAELRGRLAKLHETMTGPPWEYVFADKAQQPHTIMGPPSDGSRTSVAHTPWNRPDEEATFRGIAELRNLLPALVAALDALVARDETIRRLREAAEPVRDFVRRANIADDAEPVVCVELDRLADANELKFGDLRKLAALLTDPTPKER